jgi:hypothetical protein
MKFPSKCSRRNVRVEIFASKSSHRSVRIETEDSAMNECRLAAITHVVATPWLAPPRNHDWIAARIARG